MSVEAGIDLILMPADLPSAVWSVCDAVESGRITEERIDESVRRILRKKYELGLMEE
jgi:beta-N-acetylhexosaminidase